MSEHNEDGWHGRNPKYIKVEDLTDREKELLIDDNHFCILPWIHIHGYPEGKAYPCCDSQRYTIGDMNEQSLEEIWNGEPMKQLRHNMLNKIDSPACTKCYDKEKIGYYTIRNSMNKHFGHHIKEVLPETHEDGQLDIFKMRYYDIRFSNLCNMKCRTCGDTFSSLWADENRKRFPWDIETNTVLQNKVTYCGRHETDIIEQLIPHIPYVQQMYFAGGEPLIMPEHYTIINMLIEQERFDVKIVYNSNMSKVIHGGNNILEDWNKFKSVAVGASLDAQGPRAEYIRYGTKWKDIVENRKKMIEVCPRVDFYLSPTVSVFNVLHVGDFHRDWVEQGLIKPHSFHVNPLYFPRDRAVDVLPPAIKAEATDKLLKHIEWIKTQGREAIERCVPEFESLITQMNAEDRTDLIPEFFRVNDEVDKFRSEKFDDVFPELAEMRKYQ